MNIIDKYRTKNKLELNTKNIKTQINKNCIMPFLTKCVDRHGTGGKLDIAFRRKTAC